MTTRSVWYQSMSLYHVVLVSQRSFHCCPHGGATQPNIMQCAGRCDTSSITMAYFILQWNGVECKHMWIVTESCPTGSQSSFNASIGDTVTVSCSINYTGSAVPVLQLSSGSGAVSTDCSSSGRVCSWLSVNVRPGMTTVESHTCSVTFPQTVRVHPHCISWNSTHITVSCK